MKKSTQFSYHKCPLVGERAKTRFLTITVVIVIIEVILNSASLLFIITLSANETKQQYHISGCLNCTH